MGTAGSVARRSIEIELKGKKYVAHEPDIDELALFESHVKSKRLELYLDAAKNVNSTDRKAEINSILTTPVDGDVIQAELTSMEGVRYMAYLILRSNPGVTLDGMGAIIDLSNISEVIAIMDSLGGEDENPLQETAASP